MTNATIKKLRHLLTSHGTIVITIIVLAAVLEYLFNIQLARYLSPTDYGDIAVALTAAMFCSIVAELGATKAIQKYLPHYYELGKLNLAKGLMIFYLCLSAGIAVLFALLSTLVVYFDVNGYHAANPNQLGSIWRFFSGFHYSFIDIPYLHKVATQQYHPILLAFWIVPLIVISSILSAVLKSFNHYFLSIFPNLVLLYAVAMPLFWLCELIGFRITDWNLLALFGLTYLFICVVQFIFTYSRLPKNIVESTAHYSPPRWIKLSIPMMFSTVFFIAVTQINFTMIKYLASSEGAVGYFSAAQKVSGFILTFYLGMNVIYVPLASRVLLRGNQAIRRFLIKTTKTVFYVCFPVLVLTTLFGKSLLNLFGATYSSAYWAMAILALGNFVNVLLGYHSILLQYSNQQYLVLSIQVIALIVNATLNWWLIPIWGITGAALATATAIISMSVVISIISIKKFHQQTP